MIPAAVQEGGIIAGSIGIVLASVGVLVEKIAKIRTYSGGNGNGKSSRGSCVAGGPWLVHSRDTAESLEQAKENGKAISALTNKLDTLIALNRSGNDYLAELVRQKKS